MMWTNDRWLSNIHRVVMPAATTVAMRRRQSMAFFANPRAEVLIECIPGCSDAAHPPRHPAVAAGEHRMRKVRASEAERA
jgi:isopenicillin N synthase-like dioxygenase